MQFNSNTDKLTLTKTERAILHKATGIISSAGRIGRVVSCLDVEVPLRRAVADLEGDLKRFEREQAVDKFVGTEPADFGRSPAGDCSDPLAASGKGKA